MFSFLQKNLFEDNGRGNENKRKYETGGRDKMANKSTKTSKGKQVEMVTKEEEKEVSDSVGNNCQLMMEETKSDMDWLKSKVSKTKVSTFFVSRHEIHVSTL